MEENSASLVNHNGENGFTKREYFVAAVLQGLCANSWLVQKQAEEALTVKGASSGFQLVEMAIDITDLTLKKMEEYPS